MTDRPILMSAPMANALLDGRKTETRRLAWHPWKPLSDERGGKVGLGGETRPNPFPTEFRNPTVWQKAKPGDRLWVRETWRDQLNTYGCGYEPGYRATCCQPKMYRWRSSIYMFRWMSRLTLVVTRVRLQRLQEISHNDVTEEGASNVVEHENWFPRRWDLLHGDGAWDENPQVVALTFTVHKTNIDATGEAA